HGIDSIQLISTLTPISISMSSSIQRDGQRPLERNKARWR
ncbi:hypothetical protein ALC62_00819, partial [Cyphomyrmex costatus]